MNNQEIKKSMTKFVESLEQASDILHEIEKGTKGKFSASPRLDHLWQDITIYLQGYYKGNGVTRIRDKK